MIALWYADGELEPAPFQDGRRHIRRHGPTLIDVAASLLDALLPVKLLNAPVWTETAQRLEKGERTIYVTRNVRFARGARRLAARRHSGPGRRRAARVGTHFETVTRETVPAVEVLLYLPDGESVEQHHLNDVERWIHEKGKSDV